MDFLTHLKEFLPEAEANGLYHCLDYESQNSFFLNKVRGGELENLFSHYQSHPVVKNGYCFDKKDNPLGKEVLFYTGAYYIQEPSAMLAVDILNPQKGDFILDMCAAPGGKTIQALSRIEDEGLLVCNDISSSRVATLISNIEKFGFMNTIVLNENSQQYKKYFPHFFDKIILDAPCSGSGMFRKSASMKEDWSIEKVLSCSKMQSSLIEDAYEMLKAGGILLYSTCSYSIQENENVVNTFLSKHSNCHLLPIDENPLFYPAIGLKGAIRLHPNHFPGEGHFIVLIKKEGEVINNRVGASKKNDVITKKIPNEILSFYKEIDFPTFYQLGKCNNHFFLINFPYLDLKGLKILRYGLPIGEIEKNRFIPHHSFAMFHQQEKTNYYNLNQEEALMYLRGYTLQVSSEKKGYVIVSYKNCPLGWGKLTNGQLKNHLPKGLRIKF